MTTARHEIDGYIVQSWRLVIMEPLRLRNIQRLGKVGGCSSWTVIVGLPITTTITGDLGTPSTQYSRMQDEADAEKGEVVVVLD